MRLISRILVIFLIMPLFIVEMSAVKFKISGFTYSWDNFSPASGSTVLIDEEPDPAIKKSVLGGVKITVLYGSTFTAVDTTKPKILEPQVISDKKGEFTIKGKLDSSQTKKLAIMIEKEGYLSYMRHFDFDEKKKEYKINILMVKKIKFK